MERDKRIEEVVHTHLVEGFARCERTLEVNDDPQAVRDAKHDIILLQSMAIGRRMSPRKLMREAHELVHPPDDQP